MVGAIAQGFDQRAVVGVAVRHHRIDAGRRLDEIERAFDPLVEDGVGTHLDPVELRGAALRHAVFTTSRTARPNAVRFGTVISSYSREATTPLAPAAYAAFTTS